MEICTDNISFDLLTSDEISIIREDSESIEQLQVEETVNPLDQQHRVGSNETDL